MRRLKLAETLKGIKVGSAVYCCAVYCCAVYCCAVYRCMSAVAAAPVGMCSGKTAERLIEVLAAVLHTSSTTECCACVCVSADVPAVQVWERPAIAVTHLPTGEKWAKGYDLQLRFYSVDQYPQVGWG
jgi:hypothetical protein